jgi:hypothetical protein
MLMFLIFQIIGATEFKFSANFQAVLSAGNTVKAYVFHNEGASQNVTNANFSGFKLIGA